MCVLRVTGANFDPAEFLRTSTLRPCSVFKTGDPRIASRPHGPVWSSSGFTIAVSDAAWSDLAAQVSDACGFLERHAGELHTLSQLGAVEDIRLDFPIELRIGHDAVVAQFDYFPPDLVRAAGNLGIGIELSTYACSEEHGSDDDTESA